MSRALCFGAFLTNALCDFDMFSRLFQILDFRFNMTMAAYFFGTAVERTLTNRVMIITELHFKIDKISCDKIGSSSDFNINLSFESGMQTRKFLTSRSQRPFGP